MADGGEEIKTDELKSDEIKKNLLEEKLVIHMNIAAHQHLSMLLRPYSPGSDWKSVADLMGFSFQEITNFECDNDPVECIIRQWERKSDATVNKLCSYLKQLKRYDLIEDLQPFIDKTPLPSEHKIRVLEKRQSRVAERKLSLSLELEELTVSDEIYDGFICYSKEDRSFANEILKKLEAPPYNRKICIDYRDYVPGNCRLDQTARIIEDRCKRIVAVLSPNFKNSPEASFQVQIALSLSPASIHFRIPVIMKQQTIYKHLLCHKSGGGAPQMEDIKWRVLHSNVTDTGMRKCIEAMEISKNNGHLINGCIDANQRRVIPVIYKKCDIPPVLRHITYVAYEEGCEQFWISLAKSLDYKPPKRNVIRGPLIKKK